MRPLYIAAVLLIVCFALIYWGTVLTFQNIHIKQEYKAKIKALEVKLTKGNTIYTGCCTDTIYIYRWLTDKKFKHVK